MKIGVIGAGRLGICFALLCEQAGYDVSIIQGSPLNIKITTKDDWLLAKAIFKEIYND